MAIRGRGVVFENRCPCMYSVCVQAAKEPTRNPAYRGTMIIKSRPPHPRDHHKSLPPLFYRGTSLTRKRILLRPYRKPINKVLRGSWGGARFLMNEVPLYWSEAGYSWTTGRSQTWSGVVLDRASWSLSGEYRTYVVSAAEVRGRF